MRPAARLGLYGAGLLVLFAGTFAAADAVVPQSFVDSYNSPDSSAHSR